MRANKNNARNCESGEIMNVEKLRNQVDIDIKYITIFVTFNK